MPRTPTARCCAPEREAEVIRRLQQTNPGPFPNAGVAAVWTEIISACRGLERGMRVAFLGPQGSFSEQAAMEHFGHAVQKLPCASFDEVFRAPSRRPGRRGHGAGGKLHRGRRQPQPGPAAEHAAEDLGRALARHPPLPDVAVGQHGRHQDHLRARRRWPMPGLADATIDVARVAASSNSEAARGRRPILHRGHRGRSGRAGLEPPGRRRGYPGRSHNPHPLPWRRQYRGRWSAGRTRPA